MTNSSSFRLPSILVMLLTIITIQRISFFAFGFPSSLRPPSYTTVQMKMQSSSSNASSSFNTLYNIIPAKQRRTYSGIVLLSTSTSGSSSDEEEINDGAAKSSNGNDEQLREVEVVDDASISKSQIQSLKNSDASVSSNIKAFFNNNNKKQKFNRESLSKLGMSALLAYGFVSNVSGVIAVSCAWFIFSKKVWLGIVCLIVYHLYHLFIRFMHLLHTPHISSSLSHENIQHNFKQCA